MPYTPIASRWKDIPVILCGPILRRVTPNSVTVWVALKQACDAVTIEVQTVEGIKVIDGTAKARKIGARLYIAVVTAGNATPEPSEPGPLQPGTLYAYVLKLNGQALSTAGVYGRLENSNLELTYGVTCPITWAPSFVVPPKEWNKLHLLHGSCHKLHNEGRDAFPAIDLAIKETCADPGKRPQVLLLTGDQIYADDVAPELLTIIRDVGQYLFDYNVTDSSKGHETLDGIATRAGLDLPSGKKRSAVALQQCHFTSEELENHLLFFYEYCALYLLSWSDVLWPETEGVDPEGRGSPWMGSLPAIDISLLEHVTSPRKSREEIDKSDKRLASLIETHHYLKWVRRGLANISTYMAMDDHEVTDDWNYSANWCARVLSSDTGRNVVRNGMMGCALFQIWGNTPDQFAPGKPGGAILSELENKGHSYSVTTIETALGMPGKDKNMFDPPLDFGKYNTKNPDKFYYSDIDVSSSIAAYMSQHSWADQGPRLRRAAPGTAIKWNLTLNFPSYQIIMLDARTSRSFPGAPLPSSHVHGEYPGTLISEDSLSDQLTDPIPATCVPELAFVISPPLPMPVPGLELIVGHILESSTIDDIKPLYVFEAEEWTVHKRAFENFLARLATRKPRLLSGPGDAPDQLKRRTVVLSGDIHHSYALRVRYWASKPFKANEGTWDSVMTLLTASSFKKQDAKTKALHCAGVKSINTLFFKNYIGWANLDNKDLEPGLHQPLNLAVPFPLMVSGSPAVLCVDQTASRRWLQTQPEWRYNIQFVTAVQAEAVAKSIEPTTAGGMLAGMNSHQNAVRPSASKAAKSDKRLQGTQIVGLNNLGDIRFVPDKADTYLLQQDHWYVPNLEIFGSADNNIVHTKESTFRVSLEYDTNHDPINMFLKK